MERTIPFTQVLSKMSEHAAFLSYARHDNTDKHLSQLRTLLQQEMQSITGEVDFRIFQDVEDIGWGQQWQRMINNSIDCSSLLVPIISPMFFKRAACRDELQRFLKRESKLGRNDLILPIYFIEVDNLTSTNEDDLVATISQRNYEDWREFRFEDLRQPELRKRISDLAQQMKQSLYREPTSEEIELRKRNELTGRLEEIQAKIGGPFRNSAVLNSLSDELSARGIDTVERLLNYTENELSDLDLDKHTIEAIKKDLENHGRRLRQPSEKVGSVEKLILTPSSRAALKNAGITTVEDLISRSWNDLMLTGHFVPENVEEISLRLRLELDQDLRESDEEHLGFDDVLAQRVSA